MNQKIKSYKILSVFLGAGLALGLLLLAMIQPPAAAARSIPITPLKFTAPDSLSFQNPSSGPLLQVTNVLTRYFLPIIFKNPIIVYYQGFDSTDNIWPKGDDGKCDSVTSGGRYQLTIDADEDCFRFAPGAAEQVYGEFQVLLYHSGEYQSNSALGIYLNGKGGDNYYLFRIWPNSSPCSNGGRRYDFIRRRGGNSTTVISEPCETNIRSGYGGENANTLKVKHTNDRVITLYINEVQVKQFVEPFDLELRDDKKGTGVYGKNGSGSKPVILKYDDFTVYAVP